MAIVTDFFFLNGDHSIIAIFNFGFTLPEYWFKHLALNTLAKVSDWYIPGIWKFLADVIITLLPVMY